MEQTEKFLSLLWINVVCVRQQRFCIEKKKPLRKTLRRLEVSSIKATIELYEKVTHSATPTSSLFNDGTDKERVRFS